MEHGNKNMFYKQEEKRRVYNNGYAYVSDLKQGS